MYSLYSRESNSIFGRVSSGFGKTDEGEPQQNSTLISAAVELLLLISFEFLLTTCLDRQYLDFQKYNL